MGHFIFKSRKKLSELKEGEQINESDFATLDDAGNFYQFQYIDTEEDARAPYDVKPGIYTIVKTMMGMELHPTTFTKDKILDQFVQTKSIEDKVDCFFRKLDVYKRLGIEVPKRAMLLYGKPGTGKTTAISKICQKYAESADTAIVVWPTNAIEPYEAKEFIKSFAYKGVSRLVLVAEDVGGVEVEQRRVASDPSLLSLLDNKEKSFTIPTFILATTNHPEMFLENIGNRPDRFDDKIEVGFPPKEARTELLKFFALEAPSDEEVRFLEGNDCQRFSPAHIREVVVRSAIYDKTMLDVMKELKKEIDAYDAGFAKKSKSRVGLGGEWADD
jgi:ATP-dependent 26S proteasome regulatory subunit